MAGIVGSSCNSDEDCRSSSSNAVCLNKICACLPDFIGDNCQDPSPCTTNPCKNNGECKLLPEDGTYFCDCPDGHIHPECEEQDPCEMEGNHACENGSTCVNITPYEYICKCRIPYVGEFCESYNLCEVEMEECIEDLLEDDNPTDSICYPCVVDSNCTQISIHEYSCSCDSTINHTNCLATNYDDSESLEIGLPPPLDKLQQSKEWNPIIPTIALTYFIIYILFLVILRWNRGKNRPKIIVCCNIQEFYDFSYYLISVETGNKWNSGTGCNVYCFLCGENGNAGPFPLNDANLREVNVLQRGNEDNYLVSCREDLGSIDKIVICYDDEHNRYDEWFCEKVTVKNIKTDDNWFFFISTFIRPKRATRTYEFLAASIEYVKSWNRVSISCRHYCYQLTRHHAYISPFIYFTVERITLMFAEFMTYMLILICLYGFISGLEADFNSRTVYILTIIVLENGSITAACCFLIGIVYALCFEFNHIQRIPTLVVSRNRPVASPQDYTSEEEVVETVEEKAAFLPVIDNRRFIDKATNTDPLRVRKMRKIKRKKQVRVPVIIKHSKSQAQIVYQPQFRIPSTNIPRTERWILENVAGTSGPGELEDSFLVHDITNVSDKIPSCFYSATNIHQPPTHVNANNPIAPEISSSKSDLGEESYQTVEVEITDEEEEIPDQNLSMISTDKLKTNVEKISSAVPASTSPQSIHHIKSEPTLMAGGDSIQRTIVRKKKVVKKRKPQKQLKVYCQLVEMDCKDYEEFSGRKFFVILGWILCLCSIITATVICCIYGAKYGYRRTYNWIISLAICWAENFLFYQFLKVFVIVIVVTCLVNNTQLSSFEAEKISRRLQVCYLDELTDVPKTYKLKYIQYLPKQWIPRPGIKLPKV